MNDLDLLKTRASQARAYGPVLDPIREQLQREYSSASPDQRDIIYHALSFFVHSVTKGDFMVMETEFLSKIKHINKESEWLLETAKEGAVAREALARWKRKTTRSTIKLMRQVRALKESGKTWKQVYEAVRTTKICNHGSSESLKRAYFELKENHPDLLENDQDHQG